MAHSSEIRIDRTPSGFRLYAEMFLPAPRERLFEFFADAFQLETITPPWLNFHVITPRPIVIAAGTLIDYRLRLHKIPILWRTRISLWKPPYRFVDEQLRGPYRRWHHEHQFELLDGGTLCRDIVDYSVPGGRLINALFVQGDVLKIFRYRQQKLYEMFAH
jgi:ligand-binding SRPBCC domain-containing protein